MRVIFFLSVLHAVMPTSTCCAESGTQVWEVGQRQWTIQEEHNYSRWVEKNITDDFFIRHEIPVDCADVPYAVRWIYARISHLPAAATTGGNRLIGHWSENWKDLPADADWEKDRRFRAALLYMIGNTSTRTLSADTYPVRISPDSVTPGTMFLIPGDHAVIVSSLVLDGSATHPVQTLEAGLPPRIQRLLLRNLMMPDPGCDHTAGLRKFRWPVRRGGRWRYLPVKEYPFHSEEQYSPAFTRGCGDFLEAVAKRIDPEVHDPGDRAVRLIDALGRLLRERIPVVLEGNRKCRGTTCPEGSPLRERYSTTDRDEYIAVTMNHLDELIRENHLDRRAVLDNMAKIRLPIDDDRVITVEDVFRNRRWLSSDPDAGIEARWGLDKCGMIAGRLKSAEDSIAFIRERYGRTYPDFAGRSLMIQQKIVDELTEESRKSGCAANTRQKCDMR